MLFFSSLFLFVCFFYIFACDFFVFAANRKIFKIRALRIFQTAAFLPLSVKLLAEDQSALLRFLM